MQLPVWPSSLTWFLQALSLPWRPTAVTEDQPSQTSPLAVESVLESSLKDSVLVRSSEMKRKNSQSELCTHLGGGLGGDISR